MWELDFFFLIFISWRLITLQYCSGFCHTQTRISHGYTCIPHPDTHSHQRTASKHVYYLGWNRSPAQVGCMRQVLGLGELGRPWELDYKESWALKNWCFWTVVLKKTLESPLGCKEIQPVHPKGNHPEFSLEGLMLKLKLQYFGHLMHGTYSFERPWCWEKLMARGKGDYRGWDGCMVSPTQWTWVWVNSGSW